MKIAYLDCFSGVSGNMLLAALLDAGLPEETMQKSLARLRLPGWQMTRREMTQAGIHACSVQVTVQKQDEHRHLHQITTLLHQSELEAKVIEQAIAVFTRLAEAEARVHGTTAEKMHFHEVGALDAIIDIVGVVAGCQELGLEKIVCSPLPMPGGSIHCQHGELPLPAPAVCELLRGMPVYGEELQQELVTPTGAALVGELCSSFGPMPAMTLAECGYGAGTMRRHDKRPNLLRLLIGTAAEPQSETQQVEVIETHLDDWNPETWPHIAEQLLAAGALDVSLVPIQMKKGRPGFLLCVLSDPAHALALKEQVLRETSAIGLRFYTVRRMTLQRTIITVNTPWGTVRAKRVETGQGGRITPEYEDCRQLALDNAIPLQEIYAAVAARNTT